MPGVLLISLSFLPLLLLFILPLIGNLKRAAVITFFVTSILFFIWRASPSHYLATLFVAALGTLHILMIVFGAIFLFEVLKATGHINRISDAITNLHPRKDVQFFITAIGLTAFFEGVAGFGTPGALVPLILISLGFQPLMSIATVLLVDGLFAAFGAVGTPLIAGLQLPLQLTGAEVNEIAVIAALLLVICGLVACSRLAYQFNKLQAGAKAAGIVVPILSLPLLLMLGFSFLWPEFSTLLASMLLLIIMMFARRDKTSQKQLSGFFPYLLLVVLLLLPRIVPLLNQLTAWSVEWQALFGTEITASFQPFRSPLLPFVGIALIFSSHHSVRKQAVKSATVKLQQVLFILFPIMAAVQCMLLSGGKFSAMISIIADSISKSGNFYIFLSPFLGVLGAFITGSTTVSNLVFAPSQFEAAGLLSLNPSLVLALQLAGASLGNAICLFNIVAACLVAGFHNPVLVLKKNLMIVGLLTVVLALCGWIVQTYIL